VPFLDEVLERVDAKTKLLIEIKEKRSVNTGIEEEVVKMIKKHKAEKWCVVQSFNDESLEEVHNISPEIELQKLLFFKFRFLPFIFDGGITHFDFEKYKFVSSLNMHVKLTEESFIKMVHSNGKKTMAWGCGGKGSCTLSEMKYWDGIITNYPGDYKEN
jgi:glycerophosphoryl diester phosphodiesterase